MSAPLHPMTSIRDRLGNAPEGPERFLWGATASACLGHLVSGTSLGGRAAELAGRSVLIATRDACAAALALIELDGVARLEETLGFDPFTESDDVAYPVTLGDFIRFYEHAAASHSVDSSQAG